MFCVHACLCPPSHHASPKNDARLVIRTLTIPTQHVFDDPQLACYIHTASPLRLIVRNPAVPSTACAVRSTYHLPLYRVHTGGRRGIPSGYVACTIVCMRLQSRTKPPCQHTDQSKHAESRSASATVTRLVSLGLRELYLGRDVACRKHLLAPDRKLRVQQGREEKRKR